MEKNVNFMKNVKFMKKREIHEKTWNKVKFMEKNAKFMKKTWNSWKKTWNSWKKREIHGKTCEIHGKKRELHEKNVKFMKTTWNSWKKTWNSWKKHEVREIHINSWQNRDIHERKPIRGEGAEIHGIQCWCTSSRKCIEVFLLVRFLAVGSRLAWNSGLSVPAAVLFRSQLYWITIVFVGDISILIFRTRSLFLWLHSNSVSHHLSKSFQHLTPAQCRKAL